MHLSRCLKLGASMGSCLSRITPLLCSALALALPGCAGETSSPCDTVVCGENLVCVEGKCVESGSQGKDASAGYDGAAGSTQGKDASGDGTTFSEVQPSNDVIPSEPVACLDKDMPFSETEEMVYAPPEAKWMHIKAWGAGGNGEGCPGGIGGYSEGIFEIAPNTPLIVIVGGAGHAGVALDHRFGFGNSGGGGLSGVFFGPDTLTATSYDRAILVAGGGGGDGIDKTGCLSGIPGNHAESGGLADMQGGVGQDDGVNGGGGGYRGGKGGAVKERGVGGSGFPDPKGSVKPVGWQTSELYSASPGDEKPPNAGDQEYNGTAGQTEKNGQVIIHFTCQKPTLEPPK